MAIDSTAAAAAVPQDVAAAAQGVGVLLAGTGISIPRRVLTNDDLAGSVETTDEWIAQRTGIRQRRVVDDGVTTRHLARDALRRALRDAGKEPQELELLLCATITPEMCCPSTAARVVAELGAAPAGAMDLSAACSGFVYGLNLAASLIRTGAYRTVAVVGADTLSRITDWTDRRSCVLFGDGAGAAVLTASRDPGQGCLYQAMHSDGGRWGELYCPRIEAHVPADGAPFTGAFNTLQMNGREVYRFAVQTLCDAIVEALNACRLVPADLSMVVAHQSNARILESARDRIGLPPEKLYINIDRWGNTSAGSVPICLHELREAGRIPPGGLVLFVAMGGGLTWASSLWRM